MTLYKQSMPPKIFAIWVKTIRKASEMSQDALAAASGITERTVQRVESNGKASMTTRRCLARGLGYEDHDIFDDPTFVATATDALNEAFAEYAKGAQDNYPDHLKLAVEPVNNGAQITVLFGQCHAWAYMCDDSANVEGQDVSAALFDNVQDYGDIWNELPPSGRFEAQGAFTEMLEGIVGHGLCVYVAIRYAKLAPVAKGQAPMPFNIGYLIVVPAGQSPSQILVPKRC